MMRTDEERPERPGSISDRRLWQQCRMTDAPEDEAARLLDLAAYVDELLDAEDHDRVAALLATDPEAAADVRAARALAGNDLRSVGLERVIARACTVLPDAVPLAGRVITLAPGRGFRLVKDLARWGSIAAAVALASWLGFAMGSDASLALSDPRQPVETGFLPELFDPAAGLLRDIGEGLRT